MAQNPDIYPEPLYGTSSPNAHADSHEQDGVDELDANNIAGTEATLVDAATIAIDCATQGLVWIVTLGGNRTMGNPSNVPAAGSSFMLEIVQDGTGTRLISTWSSAWHFPGGTAPTLTTTASAFDHLGGKVNAAGKFVVFGTALDTKVTP